MASASLMPIGVGVAVPAGPADAFSYNAYRLSPLKHHVDYGTAYISKYGNAMGCGSAEPYKAHIHNNDAAGNRRNRVEGTCGNISNIRYWQYEKFYATFWCGQATPYDQVGQCYTVESW